MSVDERFDNAAVVKLVSDKISPADRVQVLTLLRGIQEYLQKADVLTSTQITYDEPLVIIRNLVIAVEETNYAQFDTSMLCSKKGMDTPRPTNQSTPATSNRKPSVYRGAAVKRPASVASESSDNDNQNYNDDDNDNDYSDNDRDVKTQSNVIEEDVVYEVQEDWQPIDTLERALTAIAQDHSKDRANYVVDVSNLNRGDLVKSTFKSPKLKNKRGPRSNPTMFLPIGEEFINPTPRVRAADRVKKWPKKARWVCVYCRRILDNVAVYKTHLHNMHKDEGKCCCRHCKKEILNGELLRYHVCRFKNKCNICHKLFITPSKLRKHMGVHIRSTVVKVTCRICTGESNAPIKHYTSARDCANHIYDEHEILIMCDSCFSEMDPAESAATDPTRIYCQSCASKAADGMEPRELPTNPNQEINLSKQDIGIYRPSTAKTRKPARRSSLKPGKTLEATNETFHCDVCDVTFDSANSYSYHVSSVKHIKRVTEHTGEDLPQFPCKECSKIFVTEKGCEEHFQRNHRTPRGQVFKCTICDKELKTTNGLSSHMKSHMDLRSFVCKDCGHGFNNNCDLSNHREWKHTVGLPQACKQCDAAFKHRRLLKHHIRLVHDRLVYKCPQCDYEAAAPTSLKYHITTVHRLKWTMSVDYKQKSMRPYTPGRKRRSKDHLPSDISEDSSDEEALAKKLEEEDKVAEAAAAVTSEAEAEDFSAANTEVIPATETEEIMAAETDAESSSPTKPASPMSTSHVICTRHSKATRHSKRKKAKS